MIQSDLMLRLIGFGTTSLQCLFTELISVVKSAHVIWQWMY